MMFDENEPRKQPVHEVGMPLDSLSIGELQERIGALEAEIVRLRGAIDAKTQSKSAAESVFKI